jgi:hypothetical protein
VPTLKQIENLGCGLTSIRMVFKYYGRDVSEKEIKEKTGGIIDSYKDRIKGVLATDLALYANSLGFNVTLHQYNLTLLDAKYKMLGKNRLKKEIGLLAKMKQGYDQRCLESYLQIIDSEIDMQMKIPIMKDIKNFVVKEGTPVILVVSLPIFSEQKMDFWRGHYIVVTGLFQGTSYYNDPETGRAHSISNDKLLFALANNVVESSGYLLAIKPKK